MGAESKAKDAYGDAFPWHQVQKMNDVGMSSQDLVVGVTADVGAAKVGTVVCRKLDLGMGKIDKAIVFEKVDVGMGKIEELHCLSTVKTDIGMAKIGKTVYHSEEELVEMACAAAGLSTAQGFSRHPYGC